MSAFCAWLARVWGGPSLKRSKLSFEHSNFYTYSTRVTLTLQVPELIANSFIYAFTIAISDLDFAHYPASRTSTTPFGGPHYLVALVPFFLASPSLFEHYGFRCWGNSRGIQVCEEEESEG